MTTQTDQTGAPERANDLLIRTLRSWGTQLRMHQTLMWVPRGLIAGLIAGLIFAAIAPTQPWFTLDQVRFIASIPPFAGGIAALVLVWVWPRGDRALARYFDREFDLKERASTAFEILSGHIKAAPPFDSLQVRDTLRHTKEVPAGDLLPLRFNLREVFALFALAAVMMLVLALLVETDPMVQVAMQREFEQAIYDQIEGLEELQQDLVDDTRLSPEARRAMDDALEEAIKTLQQQQISREEAVAAMNQASQQLEIAAQSGEGGDLSAERTRFAELASNMGEMSVEELEAFRQALQQGDYEGAAEALEDLAYMDEGQGEEMMTENDLQDLASQFDSMVEQIREFDPESEIASTMKEMADALREGDRERAAEAAERLADQMRQQGDQYDEQMQQQSQQQQASQQAQQQLQQAQMQIAQAGQRESAQDDAQDPSQDGMAQGEQGDGSEDENPMSMEMSGGGSGEEGGMPEQGGEGEMMQGLSEGELGDIDVGPNAGGDGSQTGDPGDDFGAFQSDTDMMGNVDNSEDEMGERPYDPIYAPERVGPQAGSQVFLPQGEDAAEGEQFVGEGDISQVGEEESVVPYDEVYREYLRAAASDMQTDYIPLELRDVVRDYFSSLEP